MDDYKSIEAAFLKIKKSPSDIKDLQKELSDHFHKNIEVKVIPAKKGESYFVMCITPEITIMDSVLKYMANEESKFETLCDLWHKCENWRLDIDGKILPLLSTEELTALMLHEIGHIIDSERVPRRLMSTIQFGVANSKIGQRAIMHSTGFSKVMRIPFASACQSYMDKNQIKKELNKEKRADKFASKNGYTANLISAIDKLESKIGKKNSLVDDNLSSSFDFSKDLIANLESRKDALAKKNILVVKSHIPAHTVVEECVEEIYKDWFEDVPYEGYAGNTAKEISDKVYEEAFFFKKKLDKIEQYQIDYINVKIDEIKDYSDKYLILSYINSKLEKVRWYMRIKSDPELMKKYVVPNSDSQLASMLRELESARRRALAVKIVQPGYGINVNYPGGYKG